MSKSALFTRPLAAVVTAVLLAAAPAGAQAKPIKVTMPASAVKDATSKLCMPRGTLGTNADPTLPETLCLTQDEWAAKGVTIVLK